MGGGVGESHFFAHGPQTSRWFLVIVAATRPTAHTDAIRSDKIQQRGRAGDDDGWNTRFNINIGYYF